MIDKIGTDKDPHMKNPMPMYIFIVIIIVLLIIFVAPKIVDIYQDNLEDTENRADNS